MAPLHQQQEGEFNIGWSAQFGGKQIPGDIRAMMSSPAPISPYNSIQNLYTSGRNLTSDGGQLSRGLPAAQAMAEVLPPRRKSLSAKPGERAQVVHALMTVAPEVSSVKDLGNNIPGETRDEQKSHQVC